LLELVYKNEELESIVLLPVSQKLHETQKDPVLDPASLPASSGRKNAEPQVSSSRLKELKAEEKSKSDLKEIIFFSETYLGHPLSTTDIRRLAYLYDELHMSADLIDFLIQYCVGREKTGIHYIMTVGLSWHDEGIRTVKDAKERNKQSFKNYYTIFRFFGISNRSPVPGEISDMDRWIREYGFPMTIIEEAASRTIRQTGKPSFPYAERILSDWHKAGVKNLADVTALDEQHKASSEKQNRPAASGKHPAGKFGDFPQRNDDEHKRLVEAVIRNQ
ncbi:MAG: DnaD domain protein, partial [Eubacterium sp.]|nr:DnaD domain protein [Eubacterium sp.]